MTDEPVHFLRVVPYPATLVLECPACAQPHIVEAESGFDGLWRPSDPGGDPEGRWWRCDACGAGIEAVPVRLVGGDPAA